MLRILVLCLIGTGNLLFAGCSQGRPAPNPTLEIAPRVVKETQVTQGRVRVFGGSEREGKDYEPGMTVYLAVPDGSPILQFTNPRVDFTIVCVGSKQNVSNVGCSLWVQEGKRDFHFSQVLTEQEAATIQNVVIERIFDTPPEPQSP